MNDDIVTRLRGWEVEPYPIPVGACIRNGAVMEEAADEIERLQADLKMFKADWQAMVKQIEQLEHEVKRLRRANAV